MLYTVLGSSGFIGSHLVGYLRGSNTELFTPHRGDDSIFHRELGHVIYCAGLTADFRTRPFDTVQAHVCHLLEVLRRAKYTSLLYLSSTRVYGGAAQAQEDVSLLVNPQDASDLYNLSKLQGESLCFSVIDKARVVRLSNVYGDDWESSNFVTTLIRAAVDEKRIVLRTSLDSSKDYIGVSEVASLLATIARSGQARLYNIAGGVNVSNRQIVERIQAVSGCELEVQSGAPTVSFPRIDIRRIREEFGFVPGNILDAIPELIQHFKQWKSGQVERL
ncbi:MAG TPA: SDR family oxidoreductase [Terriglobia bacterium]|nr:SDR family oxidoreductase [Terriglobia bacterium]